MGGGAPGHRPGAQAGQQAKARGWDTLGPRGTARKTVRPEGCEWGGWRKMGGRGAGGAVHGRRGSSAGAGPGGQALRPTTVERT